MQNENRTNPHEFTAPESGTAKAGESQASPAAPGKADPEDFVRMKAWIEQARSDADRARAIAEQTREDIKDIRWELDDHGRKASRSGWTVAIVAVALVAACIYGYFKLQSDASLLAQFPAVESALNAVGQRMNAAEDKFRTWSGDWDGMNSRLGKVEKTTAANLHLARDFATEQATKVHQELQAEMDNRSQSVDATISELEATHEQDQQQIAQLQRQVASARGEASDQLSQSEQETGRELGGLRSAIDRNRDDFDDLARQINHRRVDFEISKDQTREVAPGITLTVSNTNVSYQRVEGRLHVIADGRILWIRGQGIQQPVRFYSHQDDRPYEVVFTRVLQDSAVGYVLVPGGAKAADSPAASNVAPEEPVVATASSSSIEHVAQVQ
jgi:hypothetical protein